ncbi:MAG: C40 family peptidase, partial [Lachnospiraceae bacterium]|nr:C40 family peptidase [Lachnospiraceae bacterium]
VGSSVGGLENAQPGDIVCYSGHVGIYIGDGQIVHASTAKTGIIISNASYRSVLSVRRIF